MKTKKLLGSILSLVFVTMGANAFAGENNLTVFNKYGKTIKIVRASSDHDFVTQPKGKMIKVNEKLIISTVPKNSYWVEVGTSEQNLERVYVEYDNTKDKYAINLINQVGTVCMNKMDNANFSVEVLACSKE